MWNTVLAILGSIGSGGAIVMAMASWLGKVWANRIIAKETAEYKERLERLCKELERKNHVSKVRFDAEFEIYRELCESSEKMIYTAYWLFPNGLDTVPGDEDKLHDLYKQRYQDALQAHNNAVRILGANCAFISEEIYESFRKIMNLCYSQISCYQNGMNNEFYDKLSQDCFERTDEIFEKNKSLQRQLREYLKTLDVLS